MINEFKMYNSVALVYLQSCAFITSINFWTLSSHQKETLYQLAITPQLPPPQFLDTAYLLYVFIGLPILDISYK